MFQFCLGYFGPCHTGSHLITQRNANPANIIKSIRDHYLLKKIDSLHYFFQLGLQKIKAFLLPSILLGIFGSALVILLDALVFNPLLMAELGEKAAALNQEALQPAAWKGLLAVPTGSQPVALPGPS